MEFMVNWIVGTAYAAILTSKNAYAVSMNTDRISAMYEKAMRFLKEI